MLCPILSDVTKTSRSVQELAEAREFIASGEARRIREAARLSLADVAGAVGADYSGVGRWERGERVPRGPAAIKYARLLTRLRTQLEAT
jgi:DNA-binding transcriptional regulator YiaG